MNFLAKLTGWYLRFCPWPGESSVLSLSLFLSLSCYSVMPWHSLFSGQKPGPETMETRGRWVSTRVCKVATIAAITFRSRVVCIVWCTMWKASKDFSMCLSLEDILHSSAFPLPFLFTIGDIRYLYFYSLILKLILIRYLR